MFLKFNTFAGLAAHTASLFLTASAAQAFSTDVYEVCRMPQDQSYVALKSEASQDSDTVKKLSLGDRVEDWAQQDGWMNVDVQEVGRPTGWVQLENLCLIEDH